MIGFVAGVIAGVAVGAIALLVARNRTRRRAEQLEGTIQQLERSAAEHVRREARLELALSSMTQGAVISDERGRVVLRNAFAQTFVDARHGDALVGAAIDELLAAACHGETADREIDLYGPPPRTLFVHASPLRDGDELIGAIATVDDVSEQQRIDAVRRDFVANISHELKTPVGALALLAETLADEPDPDVSQRLAARMRDEAFRVNQVIDDLLTLSRIEGEGAVTEEIVSAAAIVAEAVDRIRVAAEHRKVHIDVTDIPADLQLLGDRRQLTSALYNLLENAVMYSDEGSVVHVRAAGDGNEVSFVVQDHGIGIPAKDLPRVFERFYRVDQARSRATGGTGLGLAIVRHVARNHGGDVHVNSREGEGSTFSLVLPDRLHAIDPMPEHA